MKNRKINILLAVSIGAIITFSGCSKDDGAIPKNVIVDEVPAITTTVDATGSLFISFASQATFSGKFKSDLFFLGATPPTKVDIVVRKSNSGSAVTNANVLLYKAGITSLPASYTVTAAEIVALFGPIALNDQFDFAPDIYVGTQKYQAFPAIGAGTGQGIINMPLFREFARFRAQ